MLGYLAEKGPALAANGYPIVPVRPRSKVPSIDRWPDYKATPENIERLATNGHANDGIGLLTGEIVCVDADIFDAGIIDKLRPWLLVDGQKPPERVGNPPKRAFLFRAERVHPKRVSPTYIDGEGRENKVEFLGKGQQVVIYGIHPVTGKPYRWVDEKYRSPEATYADDLPVLSEVRRDAIIRRFCELAEAQGWKRKDEGAAPPPENDHSELSPDDRALPPPKLTNEELAAKVNSIPNDDCPYGDDGDWYALGWFKMLSAIANATRKSAFGHDLAWEWSSKSSKHDDAKFELTWRSLEKSQSGRKPISAWYILHHAKKHQSRSAAALRPINPTTLTDVGIPPREWLVPDWIPMLRASVLYGEGGRGKTLLLQMLATAGALKDRTWLGLPVTPCRSVLFFCEDDLEEMHRRQADINRYYNCTFDDLGAMLWLPRLADDNVLATFDRDGALRRTPLFEQLLGCARDRGARLVLTDTLADIFDDNENDRGKARKYVQGTLAYLAREINGASITAAHPSRAGMNSGSGDSGSTAWVGTFRSQMVLTLPSNQGQPTDPDERVLKNMKINAARRGAEISLHWRNGVFVPVADLGEEREPCEKVFLRLLDKFTERGINVSANNHATNYAPTRFVADPDNPRYTKRDFAAAMDVLFKKQEICAEQYGKPSDDTRRVVRDTSL